MSFEATAIALNHSRAKGTTLLVLIGIASHDGDGGSWPSIRTLARYGRCDERTVQRAIAKLQSWGEIAVEQQGGGLASTPDHRRPNLYVFLLSCPEDCDGSKQHRTRQMVLHDRMARVTRTSPGDTHVTPPGDTHVTPPGDTHVTPPGDTHVTRTSPSNWSLEDNPTRLPGQPQSTRSAVDNRPPHECANGWLDEDDDGRRPPCLVCKPHLAARR